MKFLKNDKVQHFLVGMGLTLPIFLIPGGLSGIAPLALLGGQGLVYGAAKEVYDYFNQENHTPDWLDLAATWGGVAPVLFIYTLLNA